MAKRATTKATKTVEIAPGVVNLADAETLTAETLEHLRANPLAVYALNARLAAAIRRDCRLPVFNDLRRASDYAKRAARRRNGRISAIVPNYNYGRYICDAINSLLLQTKHIDEIIVIDDCSTDGSAEIVRSHFGDVSRLRIIQLERNSGNVGKPRNVGINASRGEYIIALDSDDMLADTYAETLYNAIAGAPSVGVVYSGVQVQREPDNVRVIIPHWPIPFSWRWSMETEPDGTVHNCIPTASLFRREMWERGGGYDEGRRCAEDADFWMRGLSVGYTALKATEEPLFIYRRHGDSMSARRIHPLATWSALHRGFKPLAAPTEEPARLHDYTEPAVSIVVPVGPGHNQHLPTAIASVLAQSVAAWEIIAVNDTSEPLPLAPYPFVREIKTRAPMSGAGAARNAGIKASRAPLVFFLDADDYIKPETLERMLRRYARGDAGYIYSGWSFIYPDSRAPVDNYAGEWSREAWLSYESRGLHGVSVLMAREDAERIGGFDEAMAAFEDWEFFARATVYGLCGAAVPEPLLQYRIHTGARREKGLAERDAAVSVLRRDLGAYIEGGKQIMSCCGGNKSASEAAEAALASYRLAPILEPNGKVMMRYTGNQEGPVTYFGKYAGCVSCEPVEVAPADVERLQLTGSWALVREEPAHSPIMPAIYPAIAVEPEKPTEASNP